MLTTPERVILIASHLSTMEDEALLLFIQDASAEVSQLPNLSADEQEKLTRWLAAHLATSRQTSSSGHTVQSLKVGDIAETYVTGGASLSSTTYGQEFIRMLNNIKKRASLKVI